MFGGALGRAALHGRAFPGVAGQRCRLEKVLPGTTMLPGAAEQVAGDRRQQVVLAKLGDLEQGQHDVQPRLRAERLGDRHAPVQLDDGGGADLSQAVVKRGDADPVGVFGSGGSRVAGGDRGLQGVGPGGAAQLVDAFEGGEPRRMRRWSQRVRS